MKNFKLLFLSLMTISFFQFTTAQTADEVINTYFQNTGGADKWRALKGLKIEGVAKYGSVEIPLEVVQQKGGKMYVKINYQGKEIIQMASDGDTRWGMNMMTMKPEKMDAESSENAKLSNQDFPDELLDYKSKGYSLEYVGKETKDGTECNKIKLTKKPIKIDGVSTADITYYYFDKDNSLPIVSESEIKKGSMKGQMSISKRSDFQEVEGLFFPFTMNEGGQDLIIKKITLNPVIDEKIFTMPKQ